MSLVKKASVFIILGVIIYFPLFLHLDYAPLYHWDESRNAINAFEMAHNNNYFVRHINDVPDTWETKPPFLVWMQILSMKTIGYNELGVRLPSAIFALFTLLLIIWWCHTEFNNILAGVFGSFVLICSKGFICIHVSRTGDHDSILSFFLLLASLNFYKFLEFDKNKNKYLSITTIAVILGVLTKSVAGLFFMPGFVIYAAYRRKLLEILKCKEVYLAILVFISFIGGYYFICEQLHPGHLQLIWDNELFPRYLNTSEIYNYKIPQSKFYYLDLILNKQFSFFWIFFIGSSFFILLTIKYPKFKKFTIYLLFIIASFLFVISNGSVNTWYDAPVFPILSIIVGLGMSLFCNFMITRFLSNKRIIIQYSAIGLFIIGVFFFPYKSIIESVSFPDNSDQYGKIMKKINIDKPEDNEYFVFYEYNNSHYVFYEKVYNKILNYRLNSCGVRGPLSKCSVLPNIGEKVLICNEDFFKEFKTMYNYTLIDKYKTCRYVVITDGN